jgi:cation diffusion facilitator CzcD-associated flavoprotein CzcO
VHLHASFNLLCSPYFFHAGQEHEVDVVILATGFDVVSAQLDLVGRDGSHIIQQFVIGQESRVYHGVNVSICGPADAETNQYLPNQMTVPKFPNYYLMLGPNTAPGHAS